MNRPPPPRPPAPAARRPPSPEEPRRRRPEGRPAKRSWGMRIAELLLWVAVAFLTAYILVSLSERILPTNY